MVLSGVMGVIVCVGFVAGGENATQPGDSWMSEVPKVGKGAEKAPPSVRKSVGEKKGEGPVDIQDMVVFPARAAPRVGVAAPPEGTVILKRELESGGSVEAWYVPAPGVSEKKPGPLAVYCHGNAEVIDQQIGMVKQLQKMGWSVLVPEYRGYGRSGGRATQDGIREDVAWFLDEVLKRPEVDGRRVVFVGRSLGGGVAADLANVRKPQGLVLMSTFTSVVAMMKPFGVAKEDVKYPFRTDWVVKGFEGPVLVFHGDHDRVIPVSHGRELGKMGKHVTYVEVASDHNDFPGKDGGPRGKYAIGLEAFLATVPRKTLGEAAATQESGEK